MDSLLPNATIEGLKEAVEKTKDLTAGLAVVTGQSESGGTASEDAGGKVFVGGFKLEISRESIEQSLGSLAKTSNTPNFRDAMEVVWFYFDPKKNAKMFDQMSLLTTLIRGSLDGNVKPPLDLSAMYQDIYQAVTQTQGQAAVANDQGQARQTGMDRAPSPAKKPI